MSKSLDSGSLHSTYLPISWFDVWDRIAAAAPSEIVQEGLHNFTHFR